jgi:N-acetylneuraminic acid mutarotase
MKMSTISLIVWHAMLSSDLSYRAHASPSSSSSGKQPGGNYISDDVEYDIYWEDLAPLPVPVSDATASTVAGEIYVIGGCDSEQGNEQMPEGHHTCQDISNSVMKYDVAANSWATGATMPQGRFRHAVAIVGTNIYIVGGRDVQDQIMKTVLIYNTQADTWVTLQTVFEQATSDNAAFAYNNQIFTCGGYTQTYDMASDTCFTMDTSAANPSFSALQGRLNVGRGDFSIVVLGGAAYAYGGFDSAFAALSSMEKLDLAAPDSDSSWVTALGTMVHSRGDFAAAAFNGRLLAIGGEDGTNSLSAGESLRHVEVYSPDLDAWLSSNQNVPIPHATFRFCGAVAGNSLYIFGGQRAFNTTCNCYPTTSDVFSYEETIVPLTDKSTRTSALVVFAIAVCLLQF